VAKKKLPPSFRLNGAKVIHAICQLVHAVNNHPIKDIEPVMISMTRADQSEEVRFNDPANIKGLARLASGKHEGSIIHYKRDGVHACYQITKII